MNDPGALTFTERRTIETLQAIWPVVGELGLAREDVYALAVRVAALPTTFSPRWADVEAWPKIDCVGIERLEAARANGRGVIVVPAHFGAYHWTMIALLHAGMAVSLLVDSRNREFFADDVKQRLLPMYFDRGMFHDRGYEVFDTIDSENPMALWQLTKSLKAGRAVIMFIDGNSGIDGRLDPKGAVVATLFGRDVWVRPGIAALARAANAAIVPVMTSFDESNNVARFEFMPALEQVEGEDRSAERSRVMRELFAWLEQQIRARPTQWEEWWLLSKWWLAAPTAEPSAKRALPTPLQLPALVGRALAVASPSLWRVPVPGGPAIFDLASAMAKADAPELLELFAAAEARTAALAWIRAQDDSVVARRLLERALELGLVEIE